VNRARESLRTTFEVAAATYDAARPDYPSQLFDDLVALTGIEVGDRLLEIGPGPGKATRSLLERGFSVVCVELGARLAEQARARLAGLPVEIHVADFETWPGDGRPFDLVYAATMWHWLDPDIRYRRAHELLRPSGHLAFWSAQHAFPDGFDPFFTEIQEVYETIGEPRESWPPPTPDEAPDERDEIEATGLFDRVQVRRYVWEQLYTADEYLALLDTFSGHIAMARSKRDHLYREIRRRIEARPDPRVRRGWHAILHTSRAKR
jgi:SAM-dependent methyltransferase